MLGRKLKKLREGKGFLQRQVAAEIEVDTAYISKVENEEKGLSRNQIPKLSKLFNVSESELEELWLCDKVIDLIKDEKNSLAILNQVINLIKKSETKG